MLSKWVARGWVHGVAPASAGAWYGPASTNCAAVDIRIRMGAVRIAIKQRASAVSTFDIESVHSQSPTASHPIAADVPRLLARVPVALRATREVHVAAVAAKPAALRHSTGRLLHRLNWWRGADRHFSTRRAAVHQLRYEMSQTKSNKTNV